MFAPRSMANRPIAGQQQTGYETRAIVSNVGRVEHSEIRQSIVGFRTLTQPTVLGCLSANRVAVYKNLM